MGVPSAMAGARPSHTGTREQLTAAALPASAFIPRRRDPPSSTTGSRQPARSARGLPTASRVRCTTSRPRHHEHAGHHRQRRSLAIVGDPQPHLTWPPELSRATRDLSGRPCFAEPDPTRSFSGCAAAADLAATRSILESGRVDALDLRDRHRHRRDLGGLISHGLIRP